MESFFVDNNEKTKSILFLENSIDSFCPFFKLKINKLEVDYFISFLIKNDYKLARAHMRASLFVLS